MKKKAVKFLDFFILSFSLLFLLSPQVYADRVWISGGDITLTIESAFTGENPTPVIDTSCSLFWMSGPEGKKKITVKTNLASPKFTLKVLAVDVGLGTAQPEVTLSTIAQDFVTSIPKITGQEESGSCTLRYTASAAAAQGMGTDIHVITYTITNQ